MSQVYGFRSYPPRAQTYLNPWTGATIAYPVLDLSSVCGPAGYADRSPTGANGVPIGAPCNARGVYGDAIKFGGVRDTLNCGSNAPLDIAGNISVFCWVNEKAQFALSVLLAKTEGVNGWYLGLNGLSRPQCYFYAGGVVVGGGAGASIAMNRWAHIGFTVLGTVCRLFVDGLEFARGAVTMSDPPGFTLYVGSGNAGGNWENGLIELPQEWNGALSPEQVYLNYLAAKDVPIYYDTFESYAVTPVAKAVGSVCGPFRVLANTLGITADAAGQKWIVSGAASTAEGIAKWPETAGYGTWEFEAIKGGAATSVVFLPMLSANAVRTDASQNGYMCILDDVERFVIYRITAGAVAAFVCATAAGYAALSTKYKIKVVRRVGGQWTLYVKGGAYPDYVLVSTVGGVGTNPATDNTHTIGEFFTVVSSATTDMLSGVNYIRVCERPASFPWEFSTGTYSGLFVGAGVIPFMNCITAGVTYIPKDFDWTQRDMGIYKGADANVTDWLMVATEIGGATTAAQNGYGVRLSADERVQLIRMDNGVVTVLAQTAAAYIAVAEYYTLRVLYNPTTNARRVLIQGGAYGDWTEAIPSTVDATYTLGNYMCFSLMAGDRITAPAKEY